MFTTTAARVPTRHRSPCAIVPGATGPDVSAPSATRALVSAAVGWAASCLLTCAAEGARAVVTRRVRAPGCAGAAGIESR